MRTGYLAHAVGDSTSRCKVLSCVPCSVQSVMLRLCAHAAQADISAACWSCLSCLRRAPLCRKMIVVEGVFANSGDVAPLQQLYRLKEAYR